MGGNRNLPWGILLSTREREVLCPMTQIVLVKRAFVLANKHRVHCTVILWDECRQKTTSTQVIVQRIQFIEVKV